MLTGQGSAAQRERTPQRSTRPRLRQWRAAALAATAAAALLSLPAVGSQAETLEDEIAALLATHPQIKAARENVAATEEGINRAFSEYLPNARLFGDYGYERIDSPGRRAAAPGQGASHNADAAQLSVTITQPLFTGFRAEANNARARLTKDVAEVELEENTQNVIFEAINAYLEVLRNARLVELSRDQENNIKRQLQLEDERVRRGSGITVDVLQSKGSLQVAKERRVALEGALEDSLSRFAQVFGHAAIVDDLVMPTPPLSLMPDSLDAAEDIALAEHPAIVNATTRIDLAEEDRRIAKADFYPSVDLVGEWTYEQDLDGVQGDRRDYKAKVQASWVLFNGFATRAAVAESSHQYRASIDTSNFVRRKVVEEVRLAWHGLETARERVRLLQNAVNIAAEVFEARRKLRDNGRETVINVLGAENELFNARINLVAAQHDARVGVYRVLGAMGRLTQDNISGLAQTDFPDGRAVAEVGEDVDHITRIRGGAEARPAPETTTGERADAGVPEAPAPVDPVTQVKTARGGAADASFDETEEMNVESLVGELWGEARSWDIAVEDAVRDAERVGASAAPETPPAEDPAGSLAEAMANIAPALGEETGSRENVVETPRETRAQQETKVVATTAPAHASAVAREARTAGSTSPAEGANFTRLWPYD